MTTNTVELADGVPQEEGLGEDPGDGEGIGENIPVVDGAGPGIPYCWGCAHPALRASIAMNTKADPATTFGALRALYSPGFESTTTARTKPMRSG